MPSDLGIFFYKQIIVCSTGNQEGIEYGAIPRHGNITFVIKCGGSADKTYYTINKIICLYHVIR
jgi:hypothetical protein